MSTSFIAADVCRVTCYFFLPEGSTGSGSGDTRVNRLDSLEKQGFSLSFSKISDMLHISLYLKGSIRSAYKPTRSSKMADEKNRQ